MTKYIVTDKGPIDRHAPGADVTGIYAPDVLARLIADGYVAEDKPKSKRKKADDAPADEDSE